MIRQTLAAGLLATLASSFTWAQDRPQSLDPRIQISLFAENPQIVTPTGIDVDEAGRVWAIESNTHFPPEGYAGTRPIACWCSPTRMETARPTNPPSLPMGFAMR